MAFNPANLEAKLASVIETQDSIAAVAQYIMFHKRQAAQAAEIWANCMPTSDRKLALVYVANEIVQQSKARRKIEFVDAFGAYIPDAFAVAYSDSSPQIRERIVRTLKVWRDRQVYPNDYLDNLDAQIGVGVASNTVPSVLQPILSNWQKLEKSSKVAAIKLQPFETQKEGLQAGSDFERLGKATTALHTGESISQAVAEAKEAQAKCLQALDEFKKSVESFKIGSPEFEASFTSVQTLKNEIESRVVGGSEKPSPTIEPLTPLNPAPDVEDDDYAPPVVYTAQNAAEGLAAASNSTGAQSDEQEPMYAESSDEEASEPEAKKSKLDLDPKLASFLATISANNKS